MSNKEFEIESINRELIRIRTLLDENLPKGKQLLTNLILKMRERHWKE